MAKEVIWTAQAKSDLQKIYEFNSPILGEEKSFELIKSILEKTELLYGELTGGTRYISKLNPEIAYQKLILGNYIIIFRRAEEVIYVNKIFDARQNPSKLNL
ncbi:MAG TPA: type II toxin-antitoxin system RelE/ParE family toxin [Cyclobacteriaceae bacterium]|nr:type II toxin-antitoxin system RelE/ParE family toxin [Cyclobacteriaceae bacterium]